jgi:hypothetical protein
MLLPMGVPEDTPEAVKAELLVHWCRVLKLRLQFIGEGLEHWKRCGNPNRPWGDYRRAELQRIDARIWKSYDLPGLVERVNRLIR